MRSLCICVAVPPVRDFYFTPRRFSSLGARTVCRLLERAGHAVSFFNFPLLAGRSRRLPLPEGLQHLDGLLMPGERGPLAFFTRYRHFGPAFAECAERIVASRPDLVLLSSFAFAYADQAVELARQIKARCPDLAIAVGGAGASVFPGYYLEERVRESVWIDFVLAGEAEVGLAAFVERFARGAGAKDYSGIPGLCARGEGICTTGGAEAGSADPEFVWNRTLDTPDRVYLATSLSRGCTRRCRFCANFIAHGRTFRTIPFERVAAGIEEFPRDRSLVLNFEDDNLLLAGEYWLEILRLCRDRFPGIAFRAENGLDHALLDEALLDELLALGMERFDLALGSADAGVLAAERRHADLGRLEQLVRRLATRAVPSVTYFICGLQDDSPDTVLRNLLYLAALPTQVGISLFYPVPGLPGFTDRSLFGAGPSALCAGSAAWPWTGALSSAQLVTAFRLARFVNLCKQEDPPSDERALVGRCLEDRLLYTWAGRERRCVPAPGVDEEMVAVFFAEFSATDIARPAVLRRGVR